MSNAFAFGFLAFVEAVYIVYLYKEFRQSERTRERLYRELEELRRLLP